MALTSRFLHKMAVHAPLCSNSSCQAGKRVRNGHPELGWGVPVEYDYFVGKVVSKINNARAQAGRNSGTKQNSNSRSSGSSASKRTRRSLKCDEDEENGGGDDEDDDGSEDEGDDDDSRDESDDPTRASSHVKKRHKTSATSRTNKTPIAVASKSAASPARKQSVRPLSSLTVRKQHIVRPSYCTEVASPSHCLSLRCMNGACLRVHLPGPPDAQQRR